MAVNLKQIKSPLKNELKEFDSYFNNSLKSRIPLLDRIMKYMVRRKGKQMRPLLVIISAAICGKINEKTFRGATMIELLHTATLIHDDVVDDSMKRRGSFTINALWKNKTAVLVGDYLLSRGLLLALRNKDNDLLDITSEAVQLMSEGELLQIEKARTLDIKEDVYFDIIKMKTASLMASSCAIGAASADASPEDQEKMKNLGLNLGIAFQIKDDLLDFKSNGTGKPKGGDLKEKKLTLPLIYALSKAEKKEKSSVIKTISRSKINNQSLEFIIGFIEKHKGFDYAIDKMNQYKNAALQTLEDFEDSDYKNSMKDLISFTIERNK